jgi:endonuclease YncB( thermonuclease family)
MVIRSLLVFAWLTSAAAAADVRVIDGDTVDIDGRRYRLAEIDTPETNKKPNCQRERDIGVAATRRLAELLTKGELTIVVVGDGGFGRDLAHVYAGEVDVGEALLLEGLALKWTRGPKAKAARIAIWCPVSLPH